MAYALNQRNYYAGLMAAKKFVVCDILAGRECSAVQEYRNDTECVKVMEYGVYLLQQMGQYFGGYKYSMCMQGTSGIVSPRLLKDINRFNRFELIGEAKEHFLTFLTEEERSNMAKLSLETKFIDDTSYSVGDYLGAMANLHYIESAKPFQDPLKILFFHTPFQDHYSNVRAYKSVRRLMR
jgi:hypothetical protein